MIFVPLMKRLHANTECRIMNSIKIRRVVLSVTVDGLERLLPIVSQRLHYPLHSSSFAQVGGGSSVLNLIYAKDQANENCEHRSGL